MVFPVIILVFDFNESSEGVLHGHSKFFLKSFFFSNGENVEGATHKHVVDLIKKGGSNLRLVVISVSQSESEKLDSDSSSGTEYYDYSDRRMAPIAVPETRQIQSNGENYVVKYYMYNIMNLQYITVVPGSIPRLCVICELSLLLILSLASRVFLPPQKSTFLNSNWILARATSLLAISYYALPS
jgi:hypothetical protein